MTLERKLSVAELNAALDKQIAYTGELRTDIDRLKFEKAELEARLAGSQDEVAELQAVLRAIKALVKR